MLIQNKLLRANGLEWSMAQLAGDLSVEGGFAPGVGVHLLERNPLQRIHLQKREMLKNVKCSNLDKNTPV